MDRTRLDREWLDRPEAAVHGWLVHAVPCEHVPRIITFGAATRNSHGRIQRQTLS